MGRIEVELHRIIINERSDEQHIFLREVGGERAFPIMIGIFEAAAIDRIIKERQFRRPLTHDLLLATIGALDCCLEGCVIDGLESDTFFAKLLIRKADGEVVAVDARPSDAIALVMGNGSPIYVEETVLAAISDALETHEPWEDEPF